LEVVKSEVHELEVEDILLLLHMVVEKGNLLLLRRVVVKDEVRGLEVGRGNLLLPHRVVEMSEVL